MVNVYKLTGKFFNGLPKVCLYLIRRPIHISGSIDPWHWLSILKNEPEYDIYGVFIEGTAHCANMAAAKDTDPVALQFARKVSRSL